MLAVFAAVVCFIGLDARALTGPEENRDAGIAAEMTISRNWTIPRLNGSYYIANPPLFYWVDGAAMKLLGRNAIAAKLPAAVFGFAAIFLVYALCRRFGFQKFAAFGAAVFFAGNTTFWEYARSCGANTMLIAFALAAWYSFLAMSDSERLRYRMRWFIAYAASLCLLGLSHGIYTVLAVSAVIAAWLMINFIRLRENDWRQWAALGGGAVIAVIPLVIWVMSLIARDEMVHWSHFIYYNHKTMAKNNTFIVLTLIIYSLFSYWKNPEENKISLLITCGILVPLLMGVNVLFACSIPIVLAGLCKYWLVEEDLLSSPKLPLALIVMGWFAILAGLALLALGVVSDFYSFSLSWYFLLAPLMLILAIVLWCRKSYASKSVGALALICALALTGDTFLFPLNNSRNSMRDLFGSAEQNLRLTGSKYLYLATYDDPVRGAAVFYLGQRVPLLDSFEDIKYFEKHQVPAFIITSEQKPELETVIKPGRWPGLFQIAKVQYKYAGGI